MIVLDTHAWLWWVGGDRRLSSVARTAIESDDEVGIPTIAVWEAATLVRKGRIRLDPDVKRWVSKALAADRIVRLTLTPEIALAAGSVADPFPGDPADRIIYATAVATGSSLVTADRRIEAFDPARVIW